MFEDKIDVISDISITAKQNLVVKKKFYFYESKLTKKLNFCQCNKFLIKNKLRKCLGNISLLKNKIHSSLRTKSEKRVTLMVSPLDSGLSALG